MPQVGFKNKNGLNVPFEQIAESYEREDWSVSLPFLMMLGRQKTVYQDLLKAYRTADPQAPHITLMPSVTQLLKSPRIYASERCVRWYEPPERSVKREAGTLMHAVIEQNVEALRASGNTRFASEITALWPVPGREGAFVPFQPDLYDKQDRILEDHKYASAYKMRKALEPHEWEIGGAHEDWTMQLNIYGFFLEHGAYFAERDPWGVLTGALTYFKAPVDALVLNLMQTDDRDLPYVQRFDVPKLPADLVEARVQEHIAAHLAAAETAERYLSGAIDWHQLQAELPPCTDRDKWAKAPSVRVYRDSNVRPSKTWYADRDGPLDVIVAEAERYAAEQQQKHGKSTNRVRQKHGKSTNRVRLTAGESTFRVELTAGEPVRCKGWCPIAGACLQLQREHPEVHAEAQPRFADGAERAMDAPDLNPLDAAP